MLDLLILECHRDIEDFRCVKEWVQGREELKD